MALARAGFIPIPPGKQPGFDHADVYWAKLPAASRLYVAHTGADRIEGLSHQRLSARLARPARRGRRP